MLILTHHVLVNHIWIDSSHFKVYLSVCCYYFPFVIVLSELS